MGIERIRELGAELTTEIEALEAKRAESAADLVGAIEQRDAALDALDTCETALEECRAEEPMPEPIITPSPVPEVNGEVILEDGFESGDFLAWSDAAEPGNPDWQGSDQGGAVLGVGGIRTVEQGAQVHSGTRSWLALVDPDIPPKVGKINKSSLERWWHEPNRSFSAIEEFCIAAWYYIPETFPEGLWTMLQQIKQTGPTHEPFSINMNRRGGISLNSSLDDLPALPSEDGIVPRGRFFCLSSRWRIAEAGHVKVWLNEEMLFDVARRTKLPHATGAYPGVENYVAMDDFTRAKIPVPGSCGLYIDNVGVKLPA